MTTTVHSRYVPSQGSDSISLEGNRIVSHGTWLCAEHPYHEVVAGACVLDPGLRKPDIQSRAISLDQARSRLAILSVSENGTINRQDLTRSDELRDHFSALDGGDLPKANRIYILEGLHSGFVGRLGARFSLDPGMFKRQERSSVFQTEHAHPNDNRLLPSSRSKHYMLLRYFEVLNFGKPLPSLSVSCGDTGRHIGANKFLDGLPSENGPDPNEGRQPNAAVRRKVSFWSKEGEDGHWNAVILCDPPIRRLRDAESKASVEVNPTPFQDGYVDFIPYEERVGMTGPPRTCFLEDFTYYFTTYASKIEQTYTNQPPPTGTERAHHGPGKDVSRASLFIKKLVAAHLLEFSTFVQAIEYDRSWQMSKLKPGFTDADMSASNDQWGAAQGLSLRCAQYVEEMASNLIELRMSLDGSEEFSPIDDWTHYRLDYRYVYQRLRESQLRLDALTGSLGDLAGMVANRISREDSRRGQMLTVVGLIFVPLAYVTGLFSMSDEYRPGKDFFWVYFAVALPIIVLMVVGMFLFNKHFRHELQAFVKFASHGRNWRWGDPQPIRKKSKEKGTV